MKLWLITALLVLMPATFGIETWPDDLHFQYLRGYHGDISCSDDFTECIRRGGERFYLPKVNLLELDNGERVVNSTKRNRNAGHFNP